MLLYELFSDRDLNNVEATLQSLSLGCEQRSLCDGRLHSLWNSVAFLPTTVIHSQSGPGPEAVVTTRKQASSALLLSG